MTLRDLGKRTERDNVFGGGKHSTQSGRGGSIERWKRVILSATLQQCKKFYTHIYKVYFSCRNKLVRGKQSIGTLLEGKEHW